MACASHNYLLEALATLDMLRPSCGRRFVVNCLFRLSVVFASGLRFCKQLEESFAFDGVVCLMVVVVDVLTGKAVHLQRNRYVDHIKQANYHHAWDPHLAFVHHFDTCSHVFRILSAQDV